MAIDIKLSVTKGDIKTVKVDYYDIRDSGVLDYKLTGDGTINYHAPGAWLTVQSSGQPGQP